MSQQPPGGPEFPQYPPQNPQQPPYGQQPGYQPYGQQYPPNPYGPGQQQKSHTTRNVLIIVTVLVVLFCAGIVGFFVWVVDEVGDGIDSSFNEDYVGSEDDPVAVDQGEEFSIRGLDYTSGWQVGPDESIPDYVNIEGLSVTNDRDDEESQTLFIVFEFLEGDEGVGEIRCSSDTAVRYERKVRMTCNGDQVPSTYDAIEVYDTATFE